MGEVNEEMEGHLKNLMEVSTMPWTYAILWQWSRSQGALSYQSGYYRGTEEATNTETKSEWFFKISMGQSFGLNVDLPGYALMNLNPVWVDATNGKVSNSRWVVIPPMIWGRWERTKWGQQHGIQTFLCIPLKEEKVLELASTEIITYQPHWIIDMAPFIHPIGTPALQPNPLPFPKRLRDELREREDSEMQNRGKKKIRNESHEREDNEMQNRGKKKISDSKCSWPSLTDSSDTGTDTTFSCSHDYSGPS